MADHYNVLFLCTGNSARSIEAVTKLIAQTRLIAVATSELSANLSGTRTQCLSMSALPWQQLSQESLSIMPTIRQETTGIALIHICHRSRGILWRVKRHRRSSEWATNGTFIPLINSGKIAEVYQRRQLSLKADVMLDRAFAQM
jgi:hypothetical protein